jgi:tetratricopeptide (TPR) repeat protein
LRRRKLHKQAADAIEYLRPEDYEDLAHHYLEAGERAQAHRYFTRAAVRAAQAYANQEALAPFRAALVLAADVADLQPASQAAVFGDLADVLARVNRYDEALAELESGIAVASAGEPNEADLLVSAELLQKKAEVLRSKGLYTQATEAIEQGLKSVPSGHPGQEGALKIALASVLAREGRLEEAQRWCEEGMEDVQAGGNFPELAHAYSLLGTIRRDLGDTEASLVHRKKSLEISETLGDIPLQIEAHNNLAVAYFDLGRMQEAIAHYEKSREFSERVGNLNTTARAQINLGEVHLIHGDWVAAQRSFDQALEIWSRTGYRLGQAYGLADMGAVLVRLGRARDALEQLARSEAIFGELGGRGFLPIVYRYQAEAHLADGSLREAEDRAQASLELARSLAAVQEEGAALRILGQIYRQKGALGDAEQHLGRSIKIFQSAGIQYEEARGLYELAEVLYDGRTFAKGIPELEKAIEQFQSVGAAFDLSLAQALRAKLQL